MKGEVTGEIILVVAVLLSVAILLLQVQQLAYFQVESSKSLMTKSIAKDIVNIIDSMGTMTGDAKLEYEPPRMWYNLNITDGFVFATGKDGKTSSVPYTFDCVISNTIENQRKILIEKKDGCIYIGTYTSCTSTEECESGYCWGNERDVYVCQDSCATQLKYAPDESSCCPSMGWDEVTKTCFNTASCSAHEHECNSTSSCCPGLTCVDEHGDNVEDGHCCFEGWYWNETENSCMEHKKTLTILIIPVNWDGKVDYDDSADFIANYYLERIPLRECPDQFKYIKTVPGEDYGSSWSGGSCNVNSHEKEDSCYDAQVLFGISECAKQYSAKTGNDYRFVVGIDDDNIAVYNGSSCRFEVGGWSFGPASDSVIVEAPEEVLGAGIATHELGHQFRGIMEQYCDCTGTSAENKCSTNPSSVPNPLRSSLGCGGFTDSSCMIKQVEFYGETCYAVHGNFDMMAKDTNGDGKLDTGNRTVMSNKIYEGEQGYYSIDEYNIIKSDGAMECLL